MTTRLYFYDLTQAHWEQVQSIAFGDIDNSTAPDIFFLDFTNDRELNKTCGLLVRSKIKFSIH